MDTFEARLERQRKEIAVARRQVELRQRQVEDLTIRAPFTGIVVAKNAQPGEMISPVSAGGGFTRTGIGTIVDIESLEIEVDLGESCIGRVAPGQEVDSMLDAWPDWKIPARVIAIIGRSRRARMRDSKVVVFLLAVTAAVILPACSGDSGDLPASPSPPVEIDAERAQAIYGREGCQVCHGENAQGMDEIAPALRDLTPYWTEEKLVSYFADPAAFADAHPDFRERRDIAYDLEMPGYEHVSEEDRRVLARWLLSLPAGTP